MAANPRMIEMGGKRFGRWTVVGKAGNYPRGGAIWNCLCDCGNARPVNGRDLRNGRSVSCGCFKAETTGNRSRTHGGSRSRLHNIWKLVRGRCTNTNHPKWDIYGGRGITVCPEWADFAAFKAWAEVSGYADRLTIERIDVNGNYEPGNCTWIPGGDQAINRRFVARDADGRLWLHNALANGISSAAYRQRVAAGWSYEEASTWPAGKRRKARSRDDLGRFV